MLWDFNALNYRDQIDPKKFDVVIPSDGSVIAGYTTIINKWAKNPNAAKLAREYILSDAGQINLARGYARPIRSNVTLPDDVKAKLLPPSSMPMPSRCRITPPGSRAPRPRRASGRNRHDQHAVRSPVQHKVIVVLVDGLAAEVAHCMGYPVAWWRRACAAPECRPALSPALYGAS